MIEELRIGIIGKVHGLKGELEVFPTTEDPKRFSSLKEVILKKEEDGLFARKDREVREVSSVRFHKDMVLLQLKGIDTIEKAEQYRKGKYRVYFRHYGNRSKSCFCRAWWRERISHSPCSFHRLCSPG